MLQQGTGELMVKDVVCCIVGEAIGEEEEIEEHIEVLQLPCAQQQLKALALTNRINEAHNLDSCAILGGLRKSQGAIRSMMLSSAKQSTIDKCFK